MTAEVVLPHAIPLFKIRLNESEKRIIAIDGPARVGKGTLAKELARNFRLRYLDSDAIYRAVTLSVIEWGIAYDDNAKIAEFIHDVTPDCLLDARIRSHEVSKLVPRIAKIPELRACVRDFQRSFVEKSSRGAVVEGRDIATNVFPEAQVKIFLTAHSRERARRAYDEVSRQGKKITIDELEKDIIARDQADMTREVDPLVQHPHAHVIDSTTLGINTVLLIARGYISSRFESF